jgi:hypothetical protein
MPASGQHYRGAKRAACVSPACAPVHRWPCSTARCCGPAGAAADHVGQLLGHHDGRRVEVAGHHLRHDRGIDDAQAFQPVHAALAVDHRHRVIGMAHLVRARRVVGGLGMLAHERIDLRIGLQRAARRDLAAAVRGQRRLREDLAGDADRRAELAPVLVVRHVVEQDARMFARSFERTWMRPRLGERIEPTCIWKLCALIGLEPL